VTIVQRLRDWARANPRVLDGGLVVLLLVFALDPLLREPRPDERAANALAVALFLLSVVPVIWRRTHPLPVLVVIGAAALAYESIGFPDSSLNALSALLAIYAVGAYTDRRQAYIGGAISAVLVALILVANWDSEAEITNIIANYVIFGTAWVAGDNIRQRRERVKALEDRAALAEAGKLEEAHRAVAAERTRIARELHDVVAHSVSVMVVQAGAARRLLQREEPDPARAIEALTSVETTGRESLTELRRLLGVLRQDDDQSFGRVPQPSIAHVDSLVQHSRDAGLDVALVVEGDAAALAPGVDLTAYRIVQEALTNAIKHAGPGAHADVRVCYADDVLEVIVADNGRGIDADRTANGGGHGLVGMEERVALFGGTLQVGNRPGGGVQVRATLPLVPAS
jgi:signal transduction histidine kinase